MSILLQREPSSASRRSTSTLIRRSSTMDRRSSLFGSLKQKFNKNSNSSSQPPESQQSSKMGFDSSRRINTQSLGAGAATPFGSGSSPTRRPNRAGMNAFSTPSNEPPPAYSPAAPGAVIGGATSPVTSPISIGGPASPSTPISPQRNTPLIRAPLPEDDRYAFLSSFDTVFLIDDSGSMAGRSWRETRQALETITPICTRHDADGIDIYFLNAADNPAYQNVTSAAEVVEIFRSVRPMGGTPTGQRLNKILKRYMAQFVEDQEHTKPLNIIVITDGEPSDDVESPIISTAKKLDKLDAPAWQIGIQFFQVGNEPGAKEHLKQLDDGLAELSGEDDLRDMVDTVPFSGAEGTELTGEGILKVVLGAVNRRLDRKKSKDLHRPILPELDGTP